MEAFLKQAKSYVKTIPKNKLYLYIFILIAVIGGSVVGLSFIQKESYSTLFSGLSPEDASMVVTKLKEQKIPYKLGLGGTAIYVPSEKVYDVRLLLVSQNALPGGGGVGFELFDKTNYGMTEFMQNINYKRAVQGELARTINQMPEVKSSRVHIAIPEKTLFTEREKEVTASVFLKMKPGKTLSKDQVTGIVHLAAGSIEGLKPENVVVIDSSGKIIYKNGNADSPIVLSGQQFELQKSVERKLEESIQSMLDKFIPSSQSIVRASVELNLRKIEKMEEEYQPNKNAITTEKKSKEKMTNQDGKVGGVPGVASNVPITGGSKNVRPESPGRINLSEREESHTTYEVSKSVRKIIEPFGDIKRVSIAIVVDGKYEKMKGQKGEELKYIPRSGNELNDIKNLVARAVGCDEERGDKIEVLNIPFETENFADEKNLVEKAERKELVFNISKYVFYLVIFVAVFLFLVRPLLDILKRREPALPLTQLKDIYVKSAAPEPVPVLEDNAQAEAQIQAALAEPMKDKALVSAIIKEWIKEGA
ncbi:MAG: flagellar M-ring protein FliF [Syntrophorhabdus aromaticivorans]|uniref:Flagellar M-ring protein n=1 Tax=Syntrophorhabdus aromaticivorans TaxID=328301 RepID=A0A351U6D9_9BACT|nr:flagellar M-ring protein FliF [Syntrophorhabdus aromaticivorans]HBA55520.1 flagellar M-ring protein FliF [Syntrophorhabdus aromaticivorans]